ncbi:hypothetical protein HX798_29095 [Pseudomonas putida]|uniref:Uncharacterized protein n=1 Tax=Pseudomonas putida TaxID=303 RepID=A0A7Y8D4C6_PSEPU|nr:hypothetical protein [Pseudomonas putida]NWC84305.1 hypothetical protein [Pseudomonas putida]
MSNISLRRTIFVVFLCGWLITPVTASEDRRTVVRELSLLPNQWRDTSHGVEYCEGIFRRYGGPESEAKCRVSVGGVSGFIGSMRDGNAIPLADALVAINGMSLNRYQGNVIRTHEKPSRALVVTYSLVERPGANAEVLVGDESEKAPEVERKDKDVPAFVYLLATILVVGFGILSLAYPLFGPLSLGSRLVIVIAGLSIGGTSNLAVALMGSLCLQSTLCIFVFCHLRSKAERARYEEYRGAYVSSLRYTSEASSLPAAPVPPVGEILRAERGVEPVVIAQSPVDLELLDSGNTLPPGRRRIVLD